MVEIDYLSKQLTNLSQTGGGGTLANSDDPEGMPHNALLANTRSVFTKITLIYF